MAGLCERCMKREARSPSDIYCDICELIMTCKHPGAALITTSRVGPDGNPSPWVTVCMDCGKVIDGIE